MKEELTPATSYPKDAIFRSIPYSVIGSGSAGNCVVIGDIMIDCGLPFKYIQEYLYDVRYLLLTHIHTDHIKETTLKRIRKMFPKITIIGNHEVAYYHEVDLIANDNVLLHTPDYTFHPFCVKHDVICHGFTWEMEGVNDQGDATNQRVLYCTDAAEMPKFFEESGAKFDLLFLESNHDQKKVEAAMKAKRYHYNVLYGSSRHLSTDQAKLFYFLNRRDKDTLFVELHKSERFY